MSEVIAFDTHRFVKHLTDNGFTEQQAEALAIEQVSLLDRNLATKADIDSLRGEIEKLRVATEGESQMLRGEIEKLRVATEGEIEKLRLATETRIEAVKSELLKWMIGALIAQGGLIVALVKLL